MLAKILKSLSLDDWLTLSETNIWCLLYCPWRKFFILLMLYLGGLILFPFTVWFEGSPVRTDIGRSLIVILVFLIKLVGLFCYPIGLAVVYVYLSGGGHWQSSRSLAVIGLAVVFLCAEEQSVIGKNCLIYPLQSGGLYFAPGTEFITL